MNDMHHFTTAISKIVSTPQEEETIIRGHRLSDLIREQPFVASAFLLLTGRLPDAGEARTLDADLILVTAKDAIKCAALDDPRLWAVQVGTRLSDPDFGDWLSATLRARQP